MVNKIIYIHWVVARVIGVISMKKKSIYILAFITLIVFSAILVACSNSNSNSNSNPDQITAITNIKLNPLVESIISDKYIDQMRCKKKDIDQILNTANLYGIKNPYIPVKGIATEYIMEVRKEQSEFAIIYPHFSITESTRDLMPIEYQERKDVKLTIGNATWVTVQGRERLFLKLNNIYISIGSAKPFIKKDFEKVIESLVQIIN